MNLILFQLSMAVNFIFKFYLIIYLKIKFIIWVKYALKYPYLAKYAN